MQTGMREYEVRVTTNAAGWSTQVRKVRDLPTERLVWWHQVWIEKGVRVPGHVRVYRVSAESRNAALATLKRSGEQV